MWYESDFNNNMTSTNIVYYSLLSDTELMKKVEQNREVKTFTRIQLSNGEVPNNIRIKLI